MHYFPAFPYTSYQHARVADIRDLFAYLKTLRAGFRQGARSRRAVSVQYPPQYRDLEMAVHGRQAVHAGRGALGSQWNRGAYLVNSLGHCAECHSPRNFLGGIIAAQRFAGGPNPEGEGWVPNITQKGLGDWSENDIAYFLETGQMPDGDSAGGSMVRVIRNTSQLSSGGSRGDRRIYQIAAAGRRTAAAAKETRGRPSVLSSPRLFHEVCTIAASASCRRCAYSGRALTALRST